MKRVLASLLICVTLAMAQARAEVRGKVHRVVNPEAPRAEWQRVPLPGAFVAVYWYMTVPAPAHATTSCLYSEFARSDANGEYIMEGPNFIAAGLTHTSYLIYSNGLAPINFPYGGSLQSEKDITMAASTLDVEPRLSRIFELTKPGCPGTKLNDPHGLLDAYHRSLLDEARTLPVASPVERNYFRSIEAAARMSSGPRKPEPIRAVVVPPSGEIQFPRSPGNPP